MRTDKIMKNMIFALDGLRENSIVVLDLYTNIKFNQLPSHHLHRGRAL